MKKLTRKYDKLATVKDYKTDVSSRVNQRTEVEDAIYIGKKELRDYSSRKKEQNNMAKLDNEKRSFIPLKVPKGLKVTLTKD